MKRLIDLDRRQQEDHDGQKGEESEEQESQEKSRSKKIREEIEEDREEDFQEKSQEAGKEGRTKEKASEEKAGSACAEASCSETASTEATQASETSRSEAPAGTRSRFGSRLESAAIAAIGAIIRGTEIRRNGCSPRAGQFVRIALEGRSSRCGLCFVWSESHCGNSRSSQPAVIP